MTNREYIENKIKEMNDLEFIEFFRCSKMKKLLPDVFDDICHNITCDECHKIRASILAQKHISKNWYVFRINNYNDNEYVSVFVKDGIKVMTIKTCTDRDKKILTDFKSACEIRNYLNSLLGYERNVWIINNLEG